MQVQVYVHVKAEVLPLRRLGVDQEVGWIGLRWLWKQRWQTRVLWHYMATSALSAPSGYTNTTWMEWMLTGWSYCSQGHMTLQICTLKGTRTANMQGLFSLEDARHAPSEEITRDWWEQVIHAAHSPGPLPTCVLKRMLFQCFERCVFWCQFDESHVLQLAHSEYADKAIQYSSSTTPRNLTTTKQNCMLADTWACV